jgi:uncharacterized protein (TIGR02588 family)
MRDTEQKAVEETSGPQTDRINSKGRSVAEWTTLAISTAILLVIVGLIAWITLAGDTREPVITVETHPERMREDASGYYLPVTIRNEGDVEEAIVLGELSTGEGQPEAAEITITFLAGGEEVQGTMVFRSNPSAGELTTAVTSYLVP